VPTNVYANITDKYGKIKQAILSYSSDDLVKKGKNITPWNNTAMKLINGNPSNGTYLATIPKQKDKTRVYFCAHFMDDLNYTAGSRCSHYNIGDNWFDVKALEVLDAYISTEGYAVVRVFDKNPIENVILHYATQLGKE
jgi:hypothetical protein